jgi:hypothetical protein
MWRVKTKSKMKQIIVGGSASLLIAACLPTNTTAQQSKALNLVCGNARITIACVKGSDCTHTLLRMKSGEGKTLLLQKPKGLDDYTAVGMACPSNDAKERYVEVEFGQLPIGCSFCEWRALYDLKGNKLTDNDPAILIDKTFDEAHQKYPNNEQITELAKKLKLDKPEMMYFQPDR